jgi:hypothetical protein
MSAGRHDRAPGTSFEERQKQRAAADERRRALVAAMSPRPSVPEELENTNVAARDPEAILKALDTLRLYTVGDTATPQRLSEEYRALLRAAIEVINFRSRLVTLCWPPHPICLPAVAQLLALGDVVSAPQRRFSPEPRRVDTISDAPKGLRALLFPFGRRSHGRARQIQVDRHQMAALHRSHLLRSVYGDDDPALKDYHTVLGRVGAMSGKGRDGRAYAEYEHPVLDEILPHGSPRDGCRENGELLWRTKSKTDLGKFSRNGSADRSNEARFFLYEVAAGRMTYELRSLQSAPDLFLLDLTKTGQGRLGGNWVSAAQKAVHAVAAAYPETGILAFTDDPWSYDTARFEILGVRSTARSHKAKPAPSRAVYAPTGSILADCAPSKAEFAGCEHVIVDGFAGQAEGAISKLRAIARKLEERGNPVAAQALRNIIAKVRRCVCLPGSLTQLSEFLERETLDDIAADNMSAYRIASDLAVLDDPNQGAVPIAPDELAAAKSDATRLVASAESLSPMASLLDETLDPVMRTSSRTIIVVRNEMIADFAVDRLSRTFKSFEHRLDIDVIRLTSRQGLADLAAVVPSYRNQFKRCIVVAPTRQSLLEILSQPWLPDELTCLADSDTLRFAARDAARLADQIGQPELRQRFETFSREASARVKQLGAHQVMLDVTVPPTEDVEFPDGAVIDLAGPQRGDRMLLDLHMQSGQRILVRPRTMLVRRDESRSVRRFVEVAAKDVGVGDEICVIGPRFVEKARTLLNITAAAAEEIRDYHDLVRRRFAEIEGANRSVRLRLVCEKMGAPPVNAGTASYWIDLDDEVDKPLHEVIAHAPRDPETFMRFTKALGIGSQLASRFWAWAVIAQRSSRLRAGAAFHEAYTGILTDQHSALAANKNRAAEIRALRAAADDYVSVVSSIEAMGTS